jgi:hypothetical protein
MPMAIHPEVADALGAGSKGSLDLGERDDPTLARDL